jgi:hypothetical protein
VLLVIACLRQKEHEPDVPVWSVRSLLVLCCSVRGFQTVRHNGRSALAERDSCGVADHG